MRRNGTRHFKLRATPQMGRSCVFQVEGTDSVAVEVAVAEAVAVAETVAVEGISMGAPSSLRITRGPIQPLRECACQMCICAVLLRLTLGTCAVRSVSPFWPTSPVPSTET